VKGAHKLNGFYAATAENFLRYCEKDLYKSAARKHSSNEDCGDFRAFGAVMNFAASHDAPGFLLVCLDIKIYAGGDNIRGNSVRLTHIWRADGGEPELFDKCDKNGRPA